MIRTNKARDITVKDDAVFFWGGPFSNWYQEYNEKWRVPCEFAIDGTTYVFGEQWLMAEKARLFGDDVQLAKILKSGSPKDIKAFGRLVRGFNDAQWCAEAQRIAYKGALAKFGQNAKLEALLLSTDDLTIVEASPDDDRWGIGLAVNDPKIRSRKNWGANWLGKALMRARVTLAKRSKARR